MFKKIEAWILYLFIILGILFAFFFGFLVRQELVGTTKFGALSKAALFISNIPSEIRQRSLGINLEIDYGDDKGFLGESLNRESYLLLSRYDGISRRNIVELVDLRTFNVVYSWRPNYQEILDSVNLLKDVYPDFEATNNPSRFRIFNPLLTKDGGIIFHHNSPLIKVNACSELVWLNEKYKFHHSNEFDEIGNIWAPSRIFPFDVDKNLVGESIDDFKDDGIAKFSPEGELIFSKSVAQLLIENNYKGLVFSYSNNFTGDPLHLNDIEPAKKDSLYWKKGDLFLSLRNISAIVHYRPNSNKVIDIIRGPFSMQHDVNILDNESITIFDNNVLITKKRGTPFVDGSNRVFVYNLRTKIFTSVIEDSILKNKIKTAAEGRSTILKNNDVFIEESNRGRLFYFNKEGKLLWKYVSVHEDNQLYRLGWSRIIDDNESFDVINKLLKNSKCQR